MSNVMSVRRLSVQQLVNAKQPAPAGDFCESVFQVLWLSNFSATTWRRGKGAAQHCSGEGGGRRGTFGASGFAWRPTTCSSAPREASEVLLRSEAATRGDSDSAQASCGGSPLQGAGAGLTPQGAWEPQK